MLYLIGIGLQPLDIPFRAVKIAKQCNERLLEVYTSITKGIDELSSIIGEIKPVYRSELEEGMNELLERARNKDIALLIIGDPLAATTHYSIVQEARNKGIGIEIIHSSSVFTAIANTGLMLYKFGRTVSLPFKEKVSIASSAYEYIYKNKSIGLHTLILLDLDPVNNRFMSINEAINNLLELEHIHRKQLFLNNTPMIACSRLGMHNENIVYATINQLLSMSIGKPPYCLILPGELSQIEEEFISYYKPKN